MTYVAVDLALDDEPRGACPDCGWGWRYAVMVDETGVFVREWHDPGCPLLDDDPEDGGS